MNGSKSGIDLKKASMSAPSNNPQGRPTSRETLAASPSLNNIKKNMREKVKSVRQDREKQLFKAKTDKDVAFDAVAETIRSAHNNYSALGSAEVLKAFRTVGGLDGVEEGELRLAFRKLRNAALRQEVDYKLSEIFAKNDVHNAGTLSILEFEQMIKSSALLEKAVYELLEVEDEEEEDLNRGASSFEEQRFEFITATVIMANCLVMAISTDTNPDWRGWGIIELIFTIIFAVEIVVRYKRASNMQEYLKNRMNIFDVLVTFLVGIDVVVTLSVSEAESWNLVNILKVFRLFRLSRLLKVISHCKELVVLLEGLASSLQSVLWSFALLALLVFLWAIIVRQCIILKWTQEDDGSLANAFKSVPESMLMMFRCWALNAEGACQDENGVPLFRLFDSNVGWIFKICWVICEGFVWIGILNVVASTFVVNAINVEQQVSEEVAMSPELQSRTLHLLKRLDKLLRTLTHPNRKHVTPKDRNVAKVAALIHENYPDAAAKMPDMCKTLVEFAENIQTALSTHVNAMTPYQANEVEACAELHKLPSAKMYLVDGEERLLVSPTCFLAPSEHLDIGVAPAGAIEVHLVQESNELEVLMEEAKELQKYMRTRVLVNDGGMSLTHKKLGTSASGKLDSLKRIFCNEITDPGPKGRDRVRQKVESKYAGRWERNRDYSRLGLIYDSVDGLMKALKTFLSCSLAAGDGMQVVCVENRFAEPSRLGWRDVQILLKVRLPSSSKHHIMEVQLNLRGLSDIRDATHSFYKKIRSVLPEDAVSVVIDQLTNNTTLDLDITKHEWTECLKNAEVTAILNELRIPNVIRKDAISIVDADGSGSVSTAELREGLLLCSSDLAMSGGVVDCKLKVREIQQWLRNKIEPQMHVIQNMLLHMNIERTEWEGTMQNLLEKMSPGRYWAVTEHNSQAGTMQKAASDLNDMRKRSDSEVRRDHSAEFPFAPSNRASSIEQFLNSHSHIDRYWEAATPREPPRPSIPQEPQSMQLGCCTRYQDPLFDLRSKEQAVNPVQSAYQEQAVNPFLLD